MRERERGGGPGRRHDTVPTRGTGAPTRLRGSGAVWWRAAPLPLPVEFPTPQAAHHDLPVLYGAASRTRLRGGPTARLPARRRSRVDRMKDPAKMPVLISITIFTE